MKKEVKSRLVGLLLIVVLSFSFVSVHAEGLLPSLSETVGIAMPSLGEPLQRYPDSETENDDGSVTEIYTNVSETDFSTFSVYLEQQEAELADYHVEGSVLTAEIRAKEASFNLSYDTKTGEAKVTYPAGTFSEWMKNAKTHFDAGQKLLDEGKANEAYVEFLAISQYDKYAPVAVLLQNDDDFAAAAREKNYAPYRVVGNVVTFGRYEQDNNTANGPEEIEWIVLDYDEKNHKALLLSKYGLDNKQYNPGTNVNTTWATCELREWLNNEFLNIVFTQDELSAVEMTGIDNSPSQGYSDWKTDGGDETWDRVFLLSYAEAHDYLEVIYDDKNIKRDLGDNVREDNTNYEKSQVTPTEYAIHNGAWVSQNKKTREGFAISAWWLRSPGKSQVAAALVMSGGSLDYSNAGNTHVIRPAIWLNLDSDFFK